MRQYNLQPLLRNGLRYNTPSQLPATEVALINQAALIKIKTLALVRVTLLCFLCNRLTVYFLKGTLRERKFDRKNPLVIEMRTSSSSSSQILENEDV